MNVMRTLVMTPKTHSHPTLQKLWTLIGGRRCALYVCKILGVSTRKRQKGQRFTEKAEEAEMA